MAGYILTEELHTDTQYALVMGSGFAQGIDRLTAELLNIMEESEYQEERHAYIMAIMASARHLATSLQEAADQLDGVKLEKVGEEEASHA